MSAELSREQLRVAECMGMTPEHFAKVIADDEAHQNLIATLTPEQRRVAECTGYTPEQFVKLLADDAAQAALSASMQQTTMAEVFANCGLALPDDMALAQCSYSVAALSAQPDGRVLLQVTPAQDFTPADGRALEVPAWRMNSTIAARVIAAFSTQQPAVIDYEHQTLHTAKNGQPAPAAGWIHALRWIEGKGLHALAELTERAKEQIKKGEYRYFSPVIQYSNKTGEVTRLLMGALTNNPAIHGMAAIKAE